MTISNIIVSIYLRRHQPVDVDEVAAEKVDAKKDVDDIEALLLALEKRSAKVKDLPASDRKREVDSINADVEKVFIYTDS